MITINAVNNEECPALTFTVALEGFPTVLTDAANPAAALEAYQDGTLPGHVDVADAQGGLRVEWDMRLEIDPWNPFPDPPALQFRVAPGVLASTGDVSSDFKTAAFKRKSGDETFLDGDLDCDATTATVQGTVGFAASGELHIGPETAAYTGTTATTFTGLTRGKYSPFHTDGGARFSRTHIPFDLSAITGDAIGVKLSPKVTEDLHGLVGRWAGVWMHQATYIGGGAGSIDNVDDAYLAFAGMVRGVGLGGRGEVIVDLEHALRKVYETTILRDQFRAMVRDGYYLAPGVQFDCTTVRATTNGNADPLIVVASGATGTNEVNAGAYNAYELAAILNTWLVAEFTATRILFRVRYHGAVSTGNGMRGRLEYNDPTAGTDERTCRLFSSDLEAFKFLGWDDDAFGFVNSDEQNNSVNSPNAPRRFHGTGALEFTLNVTNVQGTYIDQSSLLPPSLLVGPGGALTEAVFKIGDLGYVRVRQDSATSYLVRSTGLTAFFAPMATSIGDALSAYTLDDDVELEVTQVLVAQSTFSDFLLRILVSTGTAGFNHATYDTLPEQLACAIPWTICSKVEDDLAALPNADKRLSLVVHEPTRLIDLLKGQFQIRFSFLCAEGGRIRVRSWTTPTTAAATVTLTEDNKGVPVEQAEGDLQWTQMQETFELTANIVKVKADLRVGTDLVRSVNVVDADSYRAHGERARTINLFNASQTGPVADDVRDLLIDFSTALPLFSRPWWKLTRTFTPPLFAQAIPGEVALITDRRIPNPETGLDYDMPSGVGGLVGWPVLIIGHRFDWGAPAWCDEDAIAPLGDELILMLRPRITSAEYAPSATVDHTAANAGYDVATKTLTCLAHAHSEASHAADASRFPATYKVRVTELDPDDPATALTWQDTVASQTGNTIVLTTGLGGWDNTKRYRVTFDDYTTCVAGQKGYAFQADDADGYIQNARQPVGLILSGSGQLGVYTGALQEVAPALYAEELIGDGVALCTGGEKDIAELANNAVGYKATIMSPVVWSDLRVFKGSGTYELIEAIPVPINCGRVDVALTRFLYLAMEFRSTDGTDAIVRATVGRMWPSGASRDDVVFTEPYEQATFTRTGGGSTTMAITAEAAIDLSHLDLGDGTFSGLAWLFIEINAKVELAAIASLRLGPLEAP